MGITPGEEALAEIPFQVSDKTSLKAITTFTNDTSAAATYNQNNVAITAALDNALSRSGLMPNQMGGNIDMNSNHVLNLPAPFSPDEPMRVVDMQQFTAGGTINFNAIPTGGAPAQVLTKNTFSNFDVSWQSIPGITGSLPTGGTALQVLVKNSSTNFDASWNSSGVPAGGTTGQFLTKNSGVNYDTAWATLSGSGLLPTGGTTDQVLAKTSATNFAATWQSSGMPRGGTATQVLTKNTGSDFDASWSSASISGTLPIGGTTGQILAKNSATNFDTGWITNVIGIPTGGTTGQVLSKNSGTNFDVSWQTDTDTGVISTGAGIVFADSSNAIFTNAQGVISPGHQSVVGNGSTNDTTAVNNIIASASEIHVLPGNYLVSSITVGIGKRIVIHTGALFTVTTTSVLDFSGSDVVNALGAQCFKLNGTGTVVGLTNSTPEMFGAKKDGVTSDQLAITAAINAVCQATANACVGNPTCWLSSGTYAIGGVGININLPAANGILRIKGAGTEQGNSTVILSKVGVTSGTAFTITGPAGSYDIQISDFRIQSASATAGATQGFFIGRTSSGIFQGNALGVIKIENIFCTGFSGSNFVQQNARCILWLRCQSWPTANSGTTTAEMGWNILAAGGVSGQSFSGDSDWDHCQIVSGGAGSLFIQISDQGVTNNNFGGIRFNFCDFYSSGSNVSTSVGVSILSSSSGGPGAGDIWFNTCQFENQTSGGPGKCIVGQAANGGTVQDLHVTDCYINGNGWATGIDFQINDQLSTARNLFVLGNYFLNPATVAVLVTGNPSGGGSNGYTVCNNTVFTGVNVATEYQFNNLVGDVVCNSNNTMFVGSPTVTTGIALTGLGGNAVVVGNNTKAHTPVSTGAGSWTNVTQANNI